MKSTCSISEIIWPHGDVHIINLPETSADIWRNIPQSTNNLFIVLVSIIILFLIVRWSAICVLYNKEEKANGQQTEHFASLQALNTETYNPSAALLNQPLDINLSHHTHHNHHSTSNDITSSSSP